MNAWWRRNGAALAALVLLVPLTVWLVSAGEGNDLLADAKVVSVAPGATAEDDGATFGPVEATASDDPLAPAGAHLIVVDLPVTDGADLDCNSPVLRETATGREWSDTPASLDDEGDRLSACYLAEASDFELRLVYLVPDEAGPFALELVSGARTFRFALDS